MSIEGMEALCGSLAPGVHPAVHPGMHPVTLACGLACTLACTLPPAHSGVRPTMHPDVHPGLTPESDAVSCRKGLSAAQINIIGLLLQLGPTVAPYKQIAADLEQYYTMKRTPGAVRGSIDRLVNRGFLRRKQARQGTLQGVTFFLNQGLICPHIRPAGPCMCPGVHPGIHPTVHPGAHPDQPPTRSILEEKDRKNLSISSEKSLRCQSLLEALKEEDITFHWPELARAGFGTVQIRQILERRAQVGEGVELVMQGLTYAEWELARQCMKTNKGEPVTSPLNWVYKILATQGYYPRPQNYISPVEQAERDNELTARREKEAREARCVAESEKWEANLTPDERQAILGPPTGERTVIPEAVRLRMHFKQNVWPRMQDSPGADAAERG